MKVIIFILLFLGCLLLFKENRLLRTAGDLLEKTKWGIDAASRQRELECREFQMRTEAKSFLAHMDRELYYSGLRLRFPGMNAEYWLALNLAVCALLLTGISVWGIQYGLCAVVIFGAVEKLLLSQLKLRNVKAVNDQLLKLLDFLGNYSITNGEITSVLFQVSRYMEEPLQSVIERCSYEAQTTGDVSGALLNMRQKVEHPKFRELVGNLEVCIRYCADLGALVSGSRRSVREYMRSAGERKGMLREAVINMVLLLGMSVLILLAVGNLVQMPVSDLLLKTVPGKIGLGVVAGVGVLFVTQLKKIHY